MRNINDNAVQGHLSENYLTRNIIAQNILDMKYSWFTVYYRVHDSGGGKSGGKLRVLPLYMKPEKSTWLSATWVSGTLKLTLIRKGVLQSGWPIGIREWHWVSLSVSINSTESFSNPQQLNLSWISVFCLISKLFHAARRTVSRTFVVWGRARTAADTANNTKPVSPSTTMYYSSKLRAQATN